ncbi:MAG: hypothetical protein JO230_01275 [Xanthobacteraceae bacterium]|nr:hypothetical protein [Xanthobacteraceae bacterium]
MPNCARSTRLDQSRRNLLVKEFASMALINRSLTVGAIFPLLLLMLTSSAQAEKAMSCQDFRAALWQAIEAHGNKITRPELDKPAGGFGPSIGYRLTELDGLDGRLNCWKEQIYNFKVSTRLSGDPNEATSRVQRFTTLAAAAICALSYPAPSPQDCASTADSIAHGAMNEYAKARARGEPFGYEVGARLNGGSRIEMEADADNLVFYLYPF